MLDFLQTMLAFVITLGLLITVHEWGHYWVAKRLGVKILRFSVGFGKPLWKRRIGTDRTEFVVALMPLGGYVKMLDEEEEREAGNEIPEADLPRTFNRQSLAARSAIVAAGPLFNLAFAVLAYALTYMWGIEGVKPIVGEVTPQSIAARAGLREGQEITAVNGAATPRWESVAQATIKQLVAENKVEYTVTDTTHTQQILHVDLSGVTLDDLGKHNLFNKLGLLPYNPPWPAIVEKVLPGGAAERGGLRGGDKILRVDGRDVTGWKDWAALIQAGAGQVQVTEVLRGEKRLSLQLVPAEKEGKGYLGVQAIQRMPWPPEYISQERDNPLTALLKGAQKTWDMSVLTLRILGKMLVLEVSVENLSGPVSIAQYAGYSFEAGVTTFLSFLALVSISLGILNLLPVPVLDGGHLFLYLLEWLQGKPVSDATRFFLQKVGLTVLLLLMSLALFNDINRLWG